MRDFKSLACRIIAVVLITAGFVIIGLCALNVLCYQGAMN